MSYFATSWHTKISLKFLGRFVEENMLTIYHNLLSIIKHLKRFVAMVVAGGGTPTDDEQNTAKRSSINPRKRISTGIIFTVLSEK